jgi:hypothetical protein
VRIQNEFVSCARVYTVSLKKNYSCGENAGGGGKTTQTTKISAATGKRSVNHTHAKPAAATTCTPYPGRSSWHSEGAACGRGCGRGSPTRAAAPAGPTGPGTGRGSTVPANVRFDKKNSRSTILWMLLQVGDSL